MGTILLAQRAAAPAADGQPGQEQAEDELEQRRNDEGRNGAAGRRDGDDVVIDRLVLVQRRHDAKAAANDERKDAAPWRRAGSRSAGRPERARPP